MRIPLIGILAVMLLIAISVAASAADIPAEGYYAGDMLNMSKVTIFDDFNRGNESVVGSFVKPSNDSWHEIFYPSDTEGDSLIYSVADDSLLINDNAEASGFFLSSIVPLGTGTQTIEFDAKVLLPSGWDDHIMLQFGNKGALNRTDANYFAMEWASWVSQGASGIDCWGSVPDNFTQYNLPNIVYNDTWHHYKVVLNKETNGTQLYVDNSLICDVGIYPPSTFDGSEFDAVTFNAYGYGGGLISLDNFVAYPGTDSPYYIPQNCTPDWSCSQFANCSANISECLNVTDLNTCGENFSGNLSDYNQNCTALSASTIIAPNGGEQYLIGSIIGVNFTAVGGENVSYDIGYSSDDGSSWAIIVNDLSGETKIDVPTHFSNLCWHNVPFIPQYDAYLTRICGKTLYSPSDGTIGGGGIVSVIDVDNANAVIYNSSTDNLISSANWSYNTNYCTYLASPLRVYAGHHYELQGSGDNGGSWHYTPPDGAWDTSAPIQPVGTNECTLGADFLQNPYSWNTTGVASSDQYLVRVRSKDNSTMNDYDQSDNPFTITCISNWSCIGYGVCANHIQPCNSVTDNNYCGVSYGGNYSEFTPLVCGYYTPTYGVGDLPNLIASILGSGIVELIGLAGLIVLVVIVVIGATKLKKVVKGR